MSKRDYSDEMREEVRAKMSVPDRLVHPCRAVRWSCRDCPWDLFQDEEAECPLSCTRPFLPDERILAVCFVALECGAL